MFIGEFSYNIDAKKRLAIPPKFRQILGGNAVVTRGIDKCLFLYPRAEWEAMAQKLAALPITKSDARGFARLMLSGAAEVEIDQLGRILLPDSLKAYAGLDKKVVVAGLYNRVEIWDEAAWETYKQKTEREVGDIAERLNELNM